MRTMPALATIVWRGPRWVTEAATRDSTAGKEETSAVKGRARRWWIVVIVWLSCGLEA